jgi:predicted TIM-barrel fold metal-dependent hydrolase
MVQIRGKEMKVIDAHVHVWNNFAGQRFGNTKIEPLGWGMVRQGDIVFRMLPPEYYNNQVPVETLLANMETAGVDKAVILQNPCYGDQRDYIKEVIKDNPGKFVSIGMIDPRDKDEVVKQMDILFYDYNVKGFKIEVPDVPFVLDDPGYDFLWKKIVDMDALVAIDLGWNQGPFDFNIDRFERVMIKYPTMKTILCHLGVSRLWDTKQQPPYPSLQRTLKLLDINKDNLYFDFSGLQVCDPTGEYPFYRCHDFIKTVKNAYGVDRLMWGSDAPMILRSCTYKQTLTCYMKYSDYLTDKELEAVLYTNAQKVYFA